ncbi:hypothetical protein JL193_07630 [Polaribacter batillariae]|uniref:Right handed beta helix region n=1 Tax=Polaribacter batillariae TaxID=2808900 RepID=A0ABX7T1I0_9FLAO|nr:hypothetical protein [Polaribacter batillariae]QTD39106.1 hypothetical protein JL193_07630 [Polaribacter batillariae]
MKIKSKETFLLLFFLFGLIIISSCRKDFDTILNTGKLEFSKDTVFLDTVFTNIGSSTYSFKVYNRSNNAITIPKIRLEKGIDSNYRLNVDGITGKDFENINILAKDSIFVFVETTIDYSQVSTPLYEDRLLFDSGDNMQSVTLITLVQDAHFLYPSKSNGVIETIIIDGVDTEVQGRFLNDSELIFTDEKPYVVYGYMVVGDESNAAKTLIVNPGVKVYFHQNSGLIINNNSKMEVNGSLNVDGQEETEITFQGDRLESDFDNIPGQWGQILFRTKSFGNKINYLNIKNASIGLNIFGDGSNTNNIIIKNTKIYNSSFLGIWGNNANIEAENLVISNAGVSCFAGVSGGSYIIKHSTFANYWNSSLRNTPSFILSNYNVFRREDEEIVVLNLNEAIVSNSIIFGNNNIELSLEKSDDQANFNYLFQNSIIKFDDTGGNFTNNHLFDFTNISIYKDIILNGNVDFKDFLSNNLEIDANSNAINKAKINITQEVPFDIKGLQRALPADIGAYQFKN